MMNYIYILIIPIGQTSTHSLHFVHFLLLSVIAPPKISMAPSLHAVKHGASDGWQCIQNKIGVSTSGVC